MREWGTKKLLHMSKYNIAKAFLPPKIPLQARYQIFGDFYLNFWLQSLTTESNILYCYIQEAYKKAKLGQSAAADKAPHTTDTLMLLNLSVDEKRPQGGLHLCERTVLLFYQRAGHCNLCCHGIGCKINLFVAALNLLPMEK